MESLTRLVSESLVRHGLDRPVDYRRLRWSRWFRCESHHSLLQVPSKPGVFALAEEITNVGTAALPENYVETAAPGCPAEPSSAAMAADGIDCHNPEAGSPKPEADLPRMLAVTRFFEDDDMAFVLDRMLTLQNPLRASLNSGRYFVRFVVIEDRYQRHSIYNALTQWLANSAEKISGIGTHFATSLDDLGRMLLSDAGSTSTSKADPRGTVSRQLPTASASVESGAAANRHCPPPFPSGF